EAELHAVTLEKIRTSGDVTEALRFEKDLLSVARDKFEWLSPIEFIDLDRLREDRNRCAHPSLIADGQAYSPSAELARLHIRSAITSVLQHPPAQGKYALERLVKEVSSEYFPTNRDAAKASLQTGPLKKARDSLIRNFVVVLLKKYLLEEKESNDFKFRLRIAAALKATFALHPTQYQAAVKEKISDIARQIEDVNLLSLVYLLKEMPDAWNYLEQDVSQKLKNYVKALPEEKLDYLDVVLAVEPLRASGEDRIKRASLKELSSNIFFALPSQLADRFIDLYLQSYSVDNANKVAKEMRQYASDFSGDQIRRLIAGASGNPKVTGSSELGPLISALRRHKTLPLDELEGLLCNHGFEKYAEDSDGLPF
ncbi:hypothetical protein, partial [Luteibacter sp.]|uniref:hypothetical protein n=1 Tax=Luteibacter sp. TaxID=1886636 RepID=UPI002F41115B